MFNFIFFFNSAFLIVFSQIVSFFLPLQMFGKISHRWASSFPFSLIVKNKIFCLFLQVPPFTLGWIDPYLTNNSWPKGASTFLTRPPYLVGELVPWSKFGKVVFQSITLNGKYFLHTYNIIHLQNIQIVHTMTITQLFRFWTAVSVALAKSKWAFASFSRGIIELATPSSLSLATCIGHILGLCLCYP